MCGSVRFTARVNINLHISYLKLQSVGVTLSGDMKLELKCNFDPSVRYIWTLSVNILNSPRLQCIYIPKWIKMNYIILFSYSITRSRKLINNKQVGRFCIPLSFACIPGVFELDVGVSASASASVNMYFSVMFSFSMYFLFS